MTLDEFLEKLKETPREWANQYGTLIRMRDGVCCPISSLRDRPCVFWMTVADQIGLSRFDRDAIMHAADNSMAHDPELRARLLDACGLSEPSR